MNTLMIMNNDRFLDICLQLITVFPLFVLLILQRSTALNYSVKSMTQFDNKFGN